MLRWQGPARRGAAWRGAPRASEGLTGTPAAAATHAGADTRTELRPTYIGSMDRTQPPADDAAAWDERVSRGLEHAPRFVRRSVEWLREPQRKWVRWPAAILLLAGSFLWFLPVLGLWMLPLGLALMSEDIPPLKGWLERVARRIEHRVRRLRGRWRG